MAKGTIFKPPNCVLCTAGFSDTIHNVYTFMAGPRLSLRRDRLTFFLHGLFGGAHTRAEQTVNNSVVHAEDKTSFAMIAGGGLDFALGRRVALRMQPDYLLTHVFGRSENNLRVSTGVVFLVRSPG